MNKTIIVSCFPGVGKEFLNKRLFPNLKIVEVNESIFPDDTFLDDVVQRIESLFNNVDVILISSRKDLRDHLVKLGIQIFLVHPDIECKEEYLKRFRLKGDSESMIENFNDNWDMWIKDLTDQEKVIRVVLGKGMYLENMISDFIEGKYDDILYWVPFDFEEDPDDAFYDDLADDYLQKSRYE